MAIFICTNGISLIINFQKRNLWLYLYIELINFIMFTRLASIIRWMLLPVSTDSEYTLLSRKWSLWSKRNSCRWLSLASVVLLLVLHRRVLFHVYDIFNKNSCFPVLCVLAVAFYLQLLFYICYQKFVNLWLIMRNCSSLVVFFSCIL